VTDDLRFRIAAALLQRAHIGPEAGIARVVVTGAVDELTDAVMAVAEPAIHQARHAMRCPLYVGPLEHRFVGKSEMLIGYVNECSCGRGWRDGDGGCPDAGLDWRGPGADDA
jgi:hypothetical protein